MMKLSSFHSLCLFMAAGALAGNPESAFENDPSPMSKAGPVKVFVLAGQSNMQGPASKRTLEHLIHSKRGPKRRCLVVAQAEAWQSSSSLR
jgi:hypothetical protein